MILFIIIYSLINNRIRIHALIWMIVISIGYYGAKGAVPTVLSGGMSSVAGPGGSMISDNNTIALAMVMTLPLMNYLRMQSDKAWVRWALFSVLILTTLSVFGSYSRGGFLALLGLSMVYWWRSSRKIVSMVVVVGIGSMFAAFMPQQYFDRLNTIETASETDGSFIGRVEARQVGINIAAAKPLGVGFRGYETGRVFQKYSPAGGTERPRAMHSIYFEVLADHGYGGLVLFLLIGFFTWRNTRWIFKATLRLPKLKWANDLAHMLELSIIGYAIGGAALSMAYYDVYWAVVAVSVSLRLLIQKTIVGMDEDVANANLDEGNIAGATGINRKVRS